MNFPPMQSEEEVKVEAEEGIDGEGEAEAAPTVQATQPKIFKNLGEMINSLQSH